MGALVFFFFIRKTRRISFEQLNKEEKRKDIGKRKATKLNSKFKNKTQKS